MKREKKDAYGNELTATAYFDGEFGTIYRSFGYSAGYSGVADAGNNLIRETDARGNAAAYTVDEDTSRNEEVTDRCGNKTAYEYDAGGKTTKVTSKKADGTAIAHVAYTYDAFDNLTEVARGDGLKYVLAYNAFHNLESIGIDGKTDKLVAYTHKNGNGRLKEIAYANGHTMKAAYNGYGQMVSEKWFENAASATPTAHYQYVYDGKGNIVRSIDITRNREYTYTYEDGKLMRAAEFDITVSNGIVTGKTLVNSVLYSYDSEGKLTRKRVVPAAGDEQVIYYENPENENPVVKFSAGGRTVTSHSKTDSFGRKVFDELQLGTGFVSRQFSYHAGQVTQEHIDAAKLKSTATTQLVSRIMLSDGRTLAYEYDAEERITKVTDSVDGVTEYVYDELGQLVTEKHKANADGNAVTVNAMTYNNYGNITSKNGKVYSYNDVWKDLLTSYDGQTITYDAQGNPTSYLGHTLAWEKGRQLKSFDGIQYTYNASGIRASKTVNGVTHTYTMDGTKILKEAWGGNTLVPLYDNEDSVCGVIYNGEPFYFFKNLQGDILAIADKNAQVVAKYSYDAWGVCTVEQDTSTAGIASVNPFRYRGYYFDAEIGMYYLQSRYYDPVVGRFVNADGVLGANHGINAYNLFSYCANSSVNHSDPTGTFYEEVGFVTNRNLDTIARKIDKMGGNKEVKTVTVIMDVALTGASFVPNPVVGGVATAISVVRLGWSFLIPSYESELSAIRKIIDYTRYRYQDFNCTYRISILWGSHSNEFKLDVYEYKTRYWTCYSSHEIESKSYVLVDTYVFDFCWNGIYDDIRSILVDMGVALKKNNVGSRFSYIYQ